MKIKICGYLSASRILLCLWVSLLLSGCTMPFLTKGNERVRLVLKAPKQVSVQASIAPIESIKWESLETLKEVEEQRSHSVSVFQGFLPSKSMPIGEPWKIKPAAALQLLRQLNKNPQLEMHIDSGSGFTISFGDKTFEMKNTDANGLWALLRAYNDDYAEIVFRIHAEFVLEDGYFTPSQFAGRLILDRHSEALAYFQLHVPPNTLNFDVNRNRQGGGFTTANGVCEIEMRAGENIPKETSFHAEIAMDTARLELAKQFYKAQAIDWVPLEDAAALAKSLDRPIHVVSADGTFMDEAC